MVVMTFVKRTAACLVLLCAFAAPAKQAPAVSTPLSEEEAMLQQLKNLTPEQLAQLEQESLRELNAGYERESQQLGETYWNNVFKGLVAGALLRYANGFSWQDGFVKNWTDASYGDLAYKGAAWAVLAQAGISGLGTIVRAVRLGIEHFQRSEELRAQLAQLRVAAGGDSLR